MHFIKYDQYWFCFWSAKHGPGTLNKDCCECPPGSVSGPTKKIGGFPVPSGYYCFHHWREVVSATWPCQELCACVMCTQALSEQTLPLPRGTTPAEEGPHRQLRVPQPWQLPSCKLGARSSMLPDDSDASPADQTSTSGSTSRLRQSGTDWCRCHCV